MIPFLDLAAQYRSIRSEIEPAISDVLESGQFILGPAVQRFERAVAAYCGTNHAVGVNSGTSALHLALLSLGVGHGDEVVTVSHTFAATVAAISYTGARPVLVDVDVERFTMDPARLEAAITSRTRAIVPVHLYGQVADMDPIVELASRAGIAVVEDAAQAHGATYKGRRAGSIGQLGCFSFYPGKNLGAYGEAGAIVTSDSGLASRTRAMRDWGQVQRGLHELQGYNYRMEAFQGAVLDVKLRHIDEWTKARQQVAMRYDKLFANSPAIDRIRLPQSCPDGAHVYHQYVIRVEDRDRVRDELLKRGVQTSVHYSRPVHLHPAFIDLGYRRNDFPVSEKIADEVVSLPIYPELSEAQARQVVAAIEESLTAIAA